MVASVKHMHFDDDGRLLVQSLWPEPRLIEGSVDGSTTMTRPADTTAYTSGDEISNSATQALAKPWVFADVARENGGAARIRVVSMFSSNNVTLAPLLWLFNALPTMVGDNAGYSHVAADDGKFVLARTLPMISTTAVGSKRVNQVVSGASVADLVLCAPNDRNLYGVLTTPAYTPISAETFKLTMIVDN